MDDETCLEFTTIEKKRLAELEAEVNTMRAERDQARRNCLREVELLATEQEARTRAEQAVMAMWPVFAAAARIIKAQYIRVPALLDRGLDESSAAPGFGYIFEIVKRLKEGEK